MTFTEMMTGFTGQMLQAWGPFLIALVILATGTRMVIVGRRNARVRAARRARAAYRAPVISLDVARVARAKRRATA